VKVVPPVGHKLWSIWQAACSVVFASRVREDSGTEAPTLPPKPPEHPPA
jgi:hypothetical protein